MSAPSLCLFVFSFAFFSSYASPLSNLPSHSHYLSLSVFFFLFFFFLPGRVVHAKRMVETANPTEYEYIEGSIPIEWDGKSGPQHHCYFSYHYYG